MEIKEITEEMKRKGIMFLPGMNSDDIKKAEDIYRICFPKSLREFYMTGVPFSGYGEADFPLWNDFSEKNVNQIKMRIAAPYRWLAADIKNGFRPRTEVPAENPDGIFNGAPLLIPIFSHRYMPQTDIADPPVLSTVGRDTVWYGKDLCDYLEREFLGKDGDVDKAEIPYIAFWSDIAG